MASRQSSVQRPQSPPRSVEETAAAIEAIAASTAVHQQLTYAQLKAFWDEQQALRRDAGTEFESHRQIQEEIRDQLAEHRKIMSEHQNLLQDAAVAVGQQRAEIGKLKEAVHSPRSRSRWGLFAENNEDVEMETTESEEDGSPISVNTRANTAGMMLAAGSLRIPPTYKGCTKRDKREFMDKYLSYSRRMQALSEASGRTLALIPVGACVEH
ncbi:hypothetical protein AeMF1_016702 [Aphanomyces euteiches]|nr:hypothetical protein AeMF1_016702 [Aphanomyces euteiches]